MDSFKDGKYIIGFLVGVICSFVVMGGIKNYYGVDDADLSDIQEATSSESQIIDKNEGVQGVDDKQSVSNVVSQTTPLNSTVTKPEDPNSPELQRLDLILKEAGKMVDRLTAEINATTK